ncbi:hypothetical protein P2Q57_22180 [Peribacillus frigoritolerans]|nr:hypothetical protein [Peribacillus frigoritolerans]
MSKETPQAEAEEAPETARGKRVPGVEIDVRIVKKLYKIAGIKVVFSFMYQ